MADTTFTCIMPDTTFDLPTGEVPITHHGEQTGRAFNFRSEPAGFVCDMEFFGFAGDVLDPGITLDYLSFRQLRGGGPLVVEGRVLPKALEEDVWPDAVREG